MFGSTAAGRRWPDTKPDGARAILLAYYSLRSEARAPSAGEDRSLLPEAGVSVDVITGSA